MSVSPTLQPIVFSSAVLHEVSEGVRRKPLQRFKADQLICKKLAVPRDDMYDDEDEEIPRDMGFPEEYEFLKNEMSLDESTLRSHPAFWELIMFEHSDPEMLIQKQIAIVALYWAYDLLQCREALDRDAYCKFQRMDVLFPHQVERNEKNAVLGKDLKPVDIRALLRVEPTNSMTAFNAIRRRVTKGSVLDLVANPDDHLETEVIRVHDNGIDVGVRTTDQRWNERYRSWMNPRRVDIYEIPADFLPNAMLKAINSLQSGHLNDMIIPEPYFTESHDSYLERKKYHIKDFCRRYLISDGLTNAQRDAVFTICTRAHMRNPFILFGPPGTGKTHTISAAVRCLTRMDYMNRILICTPSNAAADRIALKLLEDLQPEDVSINEILRLRSKSFDVTRMDKQLWAISIYDRRAQKFDIPDTWEKYRIVISTLSSTAHIVKKGVGAGFFTHILIDEAGQMCEPEMWIPLGGLADHKCSLVLCGDPKQLGPVVPLDLPDYVTRRFGAPLLRYTSMPEYRHDTRLCVQLVDCFRCHPEIVNIASDLFYDSRLLPIEWRNPSPLSTWRGLPNRSFPILFVSVPDGDEFEQSRSFGNKLEASAVATYVNRLRNDLNIAPADIGIISPYRFQTTLIRSRVPNDCTVDSVERFQGSERRVIIITTTRTRRLGFLACDLRLNTAITRPQHLLIVIGNRDALSRHRSWEMFINHCVNNNAITEFNETHVVEFSPQAAAAVDPYSGSEVDQMAAAFGSLMI